MHECVSREGGSVSIEYDVIGGGDGVSEISMPPHTTSREVTPEALPANDIPVGKAGSLSRSLVPPFTSPHLQTLSL